jgi:OOP family OmpA-OmpF porin
MKPTTRWTIAVLVAIVIGIVLLLWTRGDEPQAPPKGEVAMQPGAPKPEPKAEPAAPVKPIADEPLTATVHFDYNRSEVRSGEAPKLDNFAAKLRGRAYARLDAIGHADRIGTDSYNLALSRRRAEAVRSYLAGKDVDVKRVRTDAKGEGEPVTGEACRNMGAEDRRNQKLIKCLQRDRRVEVRLVAKP